MSAGIIKEILKEELGLAQELLTAAREQQQALKEGKIQSLTLANEIILKTAQKMNFLALLALKEQEVLGKQNYKLTFKEEQELTQLKTNLVNSLEELRNIMRANIILSKNGLRFHHLILSLLCTPTQQKIYNTNGKVKEMLQVSQVVNKTC